MALYQYSRLTADDQARLAGQVIASGRLGSIGGVHVPQLEALVSARVGRAHAVATSNATAALEAILRALDVGPGDEVLIPALGWISVGAAVTATGATAKIVPVGERLTPSAQQLAELLSPATAAVVIAHLRGMAATDVAGIAAELRSLSVPLVEDCAQAWGVRGAGSYGAAAFFSTQTYKLIATGEGGIAVCDDPALASRIRALTGDTRVRTQEPMWRGNARMPEIAAALAIPQLERLDELLERLRSLQRPAAELLSHIGTILPIDKSNGSHVGVWCATSETATALAEQLKARDLCYWHPTPGDLHLCDAWPVRSGIPAPVWSRYLDIQIPYAEGDDRQTFLDRLGQAINHAEGQRQ